MTCSTLQIELDRLNIQHVDYLSLDIEGAEFEAMSTVDFNRTQIDVITAETNDKQSRRVAELLENNGFQKMDFKMKLDTVYIHRNAPELISWFQQWLIERREYEKFLNETAEAEQSIVDRL